MKAMDKPPAAQRVFVTIHGAVQGVGFRPFIYRLAAQLHLKGWVANTSQGVKIDVEGHPSAITQFLHKIHSEPPIPSVVQNVQSVYWEPCGYKSFTIQESQDKEAKTAFVLPDIAACSECVKEIFDSFNRRFRYPFTNCTRCGPRFSIIESLPYDRPRTSMKAFAMCAECRREYEDPANRRFHAQPNACPQCGPHAALWDSQGRMMQKDHNAICETALAIRAGKIAAVKGIGGFHLMVDARNAEAINLLRRRKKRGEKPFALLFPDLSSIERACEVQALERELLLSMAAPIVLVKRKKDNSEIAFNAAPRSPYLGGMLPYSPLHHLLMRELGHPVVATSGNLSEEPICTDENEALRRLSAIADVFLVHNRKIVRSVDDSVVQILCERPAMLRRSRGYAPLPICLQEGGPDILAAGGHLKNTVALKVDEKVFISQHLGDLQNELSFQAFEEAISGLNQIYEKKTENISCDMHPDYLSTQMARRFGKTLIQVQHHHAHVVACMAENHLNGEVLGIAWDGTGYGLDGSIWGGEFLRSSLHHFDRAGTLKKFYLPGGEKAATEPRRSALALLYQISENPFAEFSDLPSIRSFNPTEKKIISQMMRRGINTTPASSMGRLFDGIASILGLFQISSFEGQAAMALEFLCQDSRPAEIYDYILTRPSHGHWEADWTVMLTQLIQDLRSERDRESIAAKFHNTLIAIAVDAAERTALKNVVLSGGCFQNKYLTEGMISRLKAKGFAPHWHQTVPPNDGGLSLGQAVCAAQRIKMTAARSAQNSSAVSNA